MFTRNGRLQKALDQKAAALSIFSDAKERLEDAMRRFHAHIAESEKIHQQKLIEAGLEKESIATALDHIASAQKTIAKINDILN